jgi:hypothetical protein
MPCTICGFGAKDPAKWLEEQRSKQLKEETNCKSCGRVHTRIICKNCINYSLWQPKQPQAMEHTIPNKKELDEWYEFLAGQGEIATDIACFITEQIKEQRKQTQFTHPPVFSETGEPLFFNEKAELIQPPKQESYGDQLERKINEVDADVPCVKEIIAAIKRIDRMSNMEFDYDVERTAAKYRAVLEVLEKHKLIAKKPDQL